MTYGDLLMIKGVVAANEHPTWPYAIEVHVSPLWWMLPWRLRRLKETLDSRKVAGIMCSFTKSWRLW